MTGPEWPHPNPLSLADHVSALLDWLREDQELPEFDEVVILDTSDPLVRYVGGQRPAWVLPATALRSMPEFSERFCQYLDAGYAWINLSP